ncbi:hypothetical protein FS837_011387 [Tulasnella sp. UAMH 9824]|nr:hypothetical protein FS837_011387 [Tulasnella sp. UAMH 9824]
MSPAEIAPAIQQKYAEHSALLAELAATDYVPVALKVNEKKIGEIEKALKQKQEAVKGLERKTKSEYKDISELQRSGTKRFLLRLKVGAENAQKTLAKEEKEYMDAFQAENNEKLAISTLEEELNNAKLSNIDLKAKADRYKKARKRLDELYVELFEGHTNDYPEEDEAEQAVKESEAKHAKDQENLTKLSQGHSWLHKAENSMEKVLERLNKAEEASLKELAAVTQNYNVYEMKDLKAAKKYALEVETYVGEARKLDPRVANLGQISIPFQDAGYQPQFGSDKGDLVIHRLISDANKECIRYHAKLEAEANKAKPQIKEATKVAVESGTDLAKKRAKLEEIRRKIFEDVYKGVLPQKGPWVPTQGIPDNEGPSPGGFGGPSPGGFGGPSPGGFGGPSPGGFGGPAFPSINVSTDSPTSVRSFPAGGFRSPHGSIEVASPAAEGGDALGFPISPAFQHPVDRIAPTEPGFRRTAEMNVIASIAAVSIPAATPWAINREAAAMLLNAAQEPIDGEDADFSMPQAPGSPQLPGGNVTIPPTPSSPGFPSSPAEAAFSTIQTKSGEEIAYDGPRVKLFKFDSTSDPAKWDDVGSGRLRVIAEKESKTVRLVVSTSQGTNPILDRPIRSGARLLPHPSSDRSFMWTLETEPKGPFAIRMSSPEAAREVYNAFERVQRIFPPPPPTSGDDIWPAMPLAPGDEPPSIPAGPTAMPAAPASTSSPPSMPSAPAEAFNAPTGAAPAMPSAPGAPVAWPQSPDRPLAMPGGMPTTPSDANKASANPATMPTSPADVKKAASSSAAGVTAGVAALNLSGSKAPSNGGK